VVKRIDSAYFLAGSLLSFWWEQWVKTMYWWLHLLK